MTEKTKKIEWSLDGLLCTSQMALRKGKKVEKEKRKKRRGMSFLFFIFLLI